MESAFVVLVEGSQTCLQLIQSYSFCVGSVSFAAVAKHVDSLLNVMSGYEGFVSRIGWGALAIHLLDELVTDFVEVGKGPTNESEEFLELGILCEEDSVCSRGKCDGRKEWSHFFFY